MKENEVIKLFKCLADKSRIQILKSLMIEDMYVELLSERLSLSPSTVSFHLKKLEECGIVTSRKEQYYMMYSIKSEIFKCRIIDLIDEKSTELDIQKEREEEYRKKVIDNFFEYGKLKSIPVQRKKRIIVLKEISKAFEENKQYSEREVNIIIADFFDDFCTIRKEMVYEELLRRDNGVYEKVNIMGE